ncbi:hypothetical protein GGF46_002200 [Coemansia sp. RSA 552]|nr:hypothetical protein GGF46_002200 [Coemansia sp. RSA 552]
MSVWKWMGGGGAAASNGTSGTLFMANGSGSSSRDEFPDNDDRYYGLVNVGNICYCSSVLQSLYFCRAFRDCVNHYPYPQLQPQRKQPQSQRSARQLRRADTVAQTKSPEASSGHGTMGMVAAQALERSASVLAGTSTVNGGGDASVNGHAGPFGGGNGAEAGKGAISRNRALTTFRGRAAGFRRKKNRSSTDVDAAAAAAAPAEGAAGNNGSDDSQNSGGTGGLTDVSGHGGQSRDAGTPSGGGSSSSSSAAQQQQQERGPLADLTEDAPSADKYGIDSTMFSELKDLFWLISTRTRRTGSLSPQGLIAKLKEVNEIFRSNAHQDAHELLNYLLNEIVENVEKISRDKGVRCFTGAPLHGANRFQGKTWVHTLFEGLLTNETRCLSCENVTSRDETILDVSVDIHENTSVTSCLNQFAAGELLCHNNKFYCDNCGGLQEAERRMRLKRLPNILALHLKRFKYHEGLGRYVKLSYRVNFPTELRVPNTTEDTEDVLYTLSAIVVHLGGGPFHGHYISIVRSGDKWVLFDDDCVEVIDENELSNYFGDFPNFGSGYVLFYERADFDPTQFDLPRPLAPQTPDPTAAAAAAAKDGPSLPPVRPIPSQHPSPIIPSLPAAARPAAPNDMDSSQPGLTAPARPPPLVPVSRSVHGAADLLTPMSPSASEPLGSPLPATYAKASAPAPPSLQSPTAASASAGTESALKAVPITPSKSRSWFSRRSKK